MKSLQQGHLTQEDAINFLSILFLKENAKLIDACETVVFSYESVDMEQMDMRDDVNYKTCKETLESSKIKVVNKYCCNECSQIVERESRKEFIESYCSMVGKNSFLWLIKEK